MISWLNDTQYVIVHYLFFIDMVQMYDVHISSLYYAVTLPNNAVYKIAPM